ncbi:putative secreted protein [Wickerhamomyces ciferrii]|uniref:Secreted protein n=1 Tax=Wickerhamomyces ciferrii (strain ATCC 14091 / BCRC 22168 / CBS 111 / JCM 3599 / NBRC 0793 / NRRL Y-1031 F-60-10) TaxID=1206466 RepID=K0KG67_WICCF|nr:uncharacterized protein BN7_1485 [Wickerhamomyces ciferrii]CCH41946.1 putative secreted protein [Wickerhamomyces ciferrii]
MYALKQIIALTALLPVILAAVKELPSKAYIAQGGKVQFDLNVKKDDLPGGPGTFLVSAVASSRNPNQITLDDKSGSISDSLSSNFVKIDDTSVIASYHYNGEGDVSVSYQGESSSGQTSGAGIKFIGSFVEDSVSGRPVNDIYNFDANSSA